MEEANSDIYDCEEIIEENSDSHTQSQGLVKEDNESSHSNPPHSDCDTMKVLVNTSRLKLLSAKLNWARGSEGGCDRWQGGLCSKYQQELSVRLAPRRKEAT